MEFDNVPRGDLGDGRRIIHAPLSGAGLLVLSLGLDLPSHL